MKKLLIICAIVVFAILIYAEDKEYQYGLGFGGGMISGSGFSFRKLNDNGGYQINFGAIMQNYDECNDCYNDELYGDYYGDHDEIYTERFYDGYGNINLGANLYKTLHEGYRSKLYLLGGGAVYMGFEQNHEQDYEYNSANDVWEKVGEMRTENSRNYTYNAGAGFGFDYAVTENIIVNLEWPLTISLSGEDVNVYMYLPQAGIHYYFK
jgi:hypothetical protein